MNDQKIIQQTLEELLLKMEADFNNVTIEEEENVLRVNIESDNASVLIGHHGETIYALQSILKTLVWKKSDNGNFNIVLDIDDYRKRQEDNVVKMADQKAKNVQSGGREETLPPMSPYFRRIVHLFLKENYSDLSTESRGEGDQRRVVIKSK
jgi:spoIIIJ-associated protein